jgi:F-type H+-transporting ATPase subunit alpha
MKKVAGRLRLDLAQYRELEAFAAFASDLDRASRNQLDRGARLVELLKQPNYSPYPVEEQVVSVWAGTEGKLDDIPVSDIRDFETQFLQYLRHAHAGVLATIAANEWNDDVVTTLDEAIVHFKQMFLGRDGKLVINEEEAEAMAEGVEMQEKVRRVKRTPPPPVRK